MQVLRSEQVAALQAVDLQLYFGKHGYSENLPNHGPATLGISDREYAEVDKLLGMLDKARGDVLASEGYAYDQQPNSSELGIVIAAAYDSSYIDLDSNYKGLLLRADAVSPHETMSIDMGEQSFRVAKAGLTALLDAASQLRIVQPFLYGRSRALLDGIPCMIADVSGQEAQKQGYPDIKTGIHNPLRDNCIVQGLGDIALTMQKSGGEPGRLAYMVGSNHRKNIQRILQAHDVPFTANHLSQKGIHFLLENTTSIFRILAHPILKLPVRSLDQKWIDDWVANAQAKTAEGLL